MGFSKAVGSAFLFGFGMIAIGMLIAIFRGSFVNRVKDLFWIDNTPFLNLMDFEYNILAIVIMITGMISVIIAGVEARKKEVAY